MEIVYREDYLKALDVIEAFHRQVLMLTKEVIDVPEVAVKISEFLKDETDMTTRLRNSLLDFKEFVGDIYLEKVSLHDFIKMRYVGKKTLSEFSDIRDNYLNRKKFI